MCAHLKDKTKLKENNVSIIALKKQFRNFTCYFFGESKWHSRSRCLAKSEICDFCEKVGHCAKCYLKRKNSLNCVNQPCLAPATALRSTFSEHVLAEISVNNISGQALVDTGSTNSYLNKEFVKRNKLPYKTIKYFANMADISLKTEICGVSYLNLTFLEQHYKNFKFYVTSNLIADSIIGDDLLQQHKSETFGFRVKKKELYISTIMPTACIPILILQYYSKL